MFISKKSLEIYENEEKEEFYIVFFYQEFIYKHFSVFSTYHDAEKLLLKMFKSSNANGIIEILEKYWQQVEFEIEC